MAKFSSGVSGNPRGRPKGTGHKQQLRKHQEYEAIKQQRLHTALAELSCPSLMNSFSAIDALLDDYIEGRTPYEYPG
jgi:hypothetical protein